MDNVQSSEPSPIAGFWRRIAAFVVDSVCLGVVGVAFGFFLSEQLVALGPWGRLLGFVVAVIYFVPLNSSLGRGQTLGKRLCGIKVVDRDGAQITFAKSFVRFLPIGVPWFLNNARFPESYLFSVWLYATSIAVFGVGLSVIYLYVFNRRSRQSLHDLLVGSYVLKADAAGPVSLPPAWTLHLAVCGLLLLASGVAPYFTKQLAAAQPFASLVNVYHAVGAESWVVHVDVVRGRSYVTSSDNGRRETTYLRITAFSRDADLANIERARQLAKRAIAADASARSLDLIEIQLVYGYDIGIASSWRSQNYKYAPRELSAQ